MCKLCTLPHELIVNVDILKHSAIQLLAKFCLLNLRPVIIMS